MPHFAELRREFQHLARLRSVLGTKQPGSEIIEILVEIGRLKFIRSTPSGHANRQETTESLLLTLRRRLSLIWQDTLLFEVETRASRVGGALKLMSILCGKDADCIKKELEKGIELSPVQVFDKYPEGVRRSQTIINNWCEESRELISRLNRDKELLCKISDSGRFDDISSISNDKSDLHNGHRSVRIVYSGNDSVVYKPRSVEAAAGYEKLVREINRKFGKQVLKSAKVISRENYGWVEFVKHTICREELLGEYYWRCGALLAAITVLRGTDFHNENIIASDNFPVPIDLECLLQPSKAFNHGDEFEDGMHRLFPTGHTVLSTGLLPEWFPLNKRTKSCRREWFW